MPIFRSAAAFVCVVGLACSAAADAATGGVRQYPQYRSVSGLAGGCFAVTPEGRFNSKGALSFSTPIGFSLSEGQRVALVSSMSYDGQPRFFEMDNTDRFKGVNGTMAAHFGFSGKWGRATVTGMALSRILDHVFNLQYQLPLRSDKVGVSVGVQDLLSQGGSMGHQYEDDGKCSRSVFAVATYGFGREVFASLAYGNYRFDGVTGNVSFPIAPNMKACAEYDGFDWNVLATFSPTERISLSLGVVNRKYAFWSATYKF